MTALKIGDRAPEVVNAIIEIPRGSRNKYEFDKEMGLIVLDRVLPSSVVYPGDYGFIPQTLCEDGDPLDVFVISRFSTFPGCVLKIRPIGALEMTDDGERDDKIIAVPEKDSYYNHYRDVGDIPDSLKSEIGRFLEVYKALENEKVAVKDWLNKKQALGLIRKSLIGN